MAGAPLVEFEKSAVVMVKPRLPMETHSFRVEFHSFISKVYRPPSRAENCVPALDKHSDWAAAGADVLRKAKLNPNAIASNLSTDQFFTFVLLNSKLNEASISLPRAISREF